MRPMSALYVALLLTLAGCHSPYLTARTTSWPSNSELRQMGVKNAVVSTSDKQSVPFIAPIRSRHDNRFIHEAETTLGTVSNDQTPSFNTPEGLISLIFHMEEQTDELGLPNKRWVEIFTFPGNIMARLQRGRVSVDQIGWSIWQLDAHNNWERLNRQEYRNSKWYGAWLRVTSP